MVLILEVEHTKESKYSNGALLKQDGRSSITHMVNVTNAVGALRDVNLPVESDGSSYIPLTNAI